MKCPFCGNPESKVIDSRPTDEGDSIRRRRECLVCRKRFAQPMDPDRIPQDIKTKWYPNEDHHILYIGEILEVLVKD